MNGETAGPIVFGTGLLAFAGSVAAVMGGALDDLVAAAAPVALLLAVAVGIIGLAARAAGSRTARPAPAAHFHGGSARRRKIDKHERKHRDKARQFGADGHWKHTDHGADFYLTNDAHLEPWQRAAIGWAPTRGSSLMRSDCDKRDNQIANQWINTYPWPERGARRRQAKRAAR